VQVSLVRTVLHAMNTCIPIFIAVNVHLDGQVLYAVKVSYAETHLIIIEASWMVQKLLSNTVHADRTFMSSTK
jgi:hypothetical protein